VPAGTLDLHDSVDPDPPDAGRTRRHKTDRRLLGLVLLVVGTWWFLQQVGWFHASSTLVLSSVLILIGIWLMFTARRRSTGWPVIAGAVILMTLMSPHVPSPHFNGANFGNSSVHPTSIADLEDTYRDHVGNFALDLSQIDFPAEQAQSVTIRDVAGIIDISVPNHVTVTLDSRHVLGNVGSPPKSAGCGGERPFVLHLEVRDVMGNVDFATTGQCGPKTPAMLPAPKTP
jgi:predicted membrane protein